MPRNPDSPRPSVTVDTASEVGRGFLWITTAKAWFLFTATLSSLVFPRLFGDPILFGQYRVVSGLLNVITMVVITATVQGVSRLCSQEGVCVRGALTTAVRVQTAVFGPVFLTLLAGAGALGDLVFRDAALTGPIRAASFVVIAYAYYAALVGTLNGTRRFASQAALDITFSTLKTGLMIGAVLLTGSVTAAFASFSVAAVGVLLVAIVVVTRGVWPRGQGEATPPSQYLAYLLPLGAYALLLNLLLQMDILGIKVALGQSTGLSDHASRVAGVYGAAKNVAMIPYQAVISVALVVFPFVSGASSRNDHQAADAMVRGAMRVCAVLSGAFVVLLVPAGSDLLVLLFGEPYRAGGPWLLPLLLGVANLAFLFVANAILTSAGHPRVTLVSGCVAVASQGGLLFLLPTSADPGLHAALSTLAGCLVGGVTSLAVLRWRFPSARWTRTLFLTVGATALALGADHLFGPKLAWPMRPLVAGAIFLAALVVTRAVGREDIATIRAVLGRRMG